MSIYLVVRFYIQFNSLVSCLHPICEMTAGVAVECVKATKFVGFHVRSLCETELFFGRGANCEFSHASWCVSHRWARKTVAEDRIG